MSTFDPDCIKELYGIKQYYVNVEREELKFDTLCDLYEQLTISQAIIYCSTRSRVDWLVSEMNKRDFLVTPFHSELSQEERDTFMKQFQMGNSRILISTDILGYSIDVQNVSIVFNYDLPSKKENYIHLSGRSGHFGRKGVVINFVTKDTILDIQDIQSFYNTQINELPQDLDSLNA